jgi:opacity protein-like surface antigen
MALPASVRSQGFYFNADAGVALADKVNLKQFFGPTPGAKLDFDPGVRFGAAGGYNFNSYLGAEFETGFIFNNIKNLGDSGDAGLSHVPLMVNAVVRYDVPDCKWVPYAGVGVGGDVSIISLDNLTATTDSGTVFVDGSDAALVFAWQAFAGVRYKINATMSLGAGYKYYSANSATWDFAGFSNAIKTGRADVHSLLVEFNLKF